MDLVDASGVQIQPEADRNSVLASQSNLKRARVTRLRVVMAVLFYFGLAVGSYHCLEGWPISDCLYYSVVLMSTVGYGDKFVPSRDSTRLCTVVLLHFAIIVDVVVIGGCVNLVVKHFRLRAHGHDHDIGIFDSEGFERRQRLFKRQALAAYVIVLCIGTLVFSVAMEWDSKVQNPVLSGFYLTIITVTTVGLGEFSPADTDSAALKAFGVCMILVGIPACAAFFSVVVNELFGAEDDPQRMRVIQGLTREKVTQIRNWKATVRRFQLFNDSSDEISRVEYLCFVLMRNNAFTVRNIENILRNFEENVSVANRDGLASWLGMLDFRLQSDPPNSFPIG